MRLQKNLCLLVSAPFMLFKLNMHIEYLMQLGFTEKEAQIYLMLLRVGPSTASTVSNRLSIKRVSAYYVLNSLCERGFVSFEQCSTGRKYIPNDPECILENLKKQELDLRGRMKVAENCVEKLQSTVKVVNSCKQKVTYHKGNNLVLKQLLKSFSPKFPIYIISPDYGTESDSSKILHELIVDISNFNSNKVFLCVPENKIDSANYIYKDCIVSSANLNSIFTRGSLILQEDKVMYLFTSERGAELMYLEDPLYSNFIKRIFLVSFFD